MKLHRGVLAALATAMVMVAATGCKGPQQDPQSDPTADPAQPGAQGASDAPPNGSDDPTMRRARRHKRRHPGGPQDGRRRRDGWRQRGNDAPDGPPDSP
jgi:predicted small lipoprotein YifL